MAKPKSVKVSRQQSESAAAITHGVIRANVNREVATSPTFVSLYTNDTQIQTTPWDVRLIFGEISEAATLERPTNVIKQVAEVRMSPQHAKILVKILMQQIEGYEANIGPIPLPS